MLYKQTNSYTVLKLITCTSNYATHNCTLLHVIVLLVSDNTNTVHLASIVYVYLSIHCTCNFIIRRYPTSTYGLVGGQSRIAHKVVASCHTTVCSCTLSLIHADPSHRSEKRTDFIVGRVVKFRVTSSI